MIHVCSLALLPDTVKATGASHVITVMADVQKVQRPPSITADNHLVISMDDINVPADGFVAPQRSHVEQVLAFGRRWDRSAPLVIHCYAGISRSTASAFAIACALNPKRDEFDIARRMRKDSPTAQPNRLIVGHADELLARNGRMIEALNLIGPGDMSIEGRPFRIELD
jgi:predicted protein tyrosine phosphatase